jgi:hypothetical protein
VTVWLPALAPGLVAAAVLLVPGLVVGRAAGLRGLVWLGVAPSLSLTVVALSAVAAPLAGLHWGVLPVLAGTALGALAAAVVGLLAADRWYRARRGRLWWLPARPTATDGAVALAAGAGLVLAGLLALRRLLRAIGTPTGVSQSYDAVFHLNAVQWVLQHGDASSFDVGRLVAPTGPVPFYPSAWHAVVALAAQLTGSGVDVSSNATAAVVAVVVWPLGLLALARAVLGRAPLALAATVALTAASTAAPVVPLDWGVLYPTLLSDAVVPAALGLLVLAADRGRPLRTRGASLAVAAALLPGLYLAQPSGVFALAVLAAPLAALVVAGWARRRWAVGQRLTAGAGGVLAVAAAAAAWHVADTNAAVVSARLTDWKAMATPAAATWQALDGGYLDRPAAPVVSVLVLVGAVVALRRARWRWLVLAHAAVSALYVLDWGVDSALSQTLTGFWYNDAYRVVALPVITGTVLAGIGASALVRLLQRLVLRVRARRAAAHPAGRRAAAPAATLVSVGLFVPVPGGLGRHLAARLPARTAGWLPVQLAASALVVAAALAAAHGPAYSYAYTSLAANYANSPDTVLSDLLDADERALLDRVDDVVPAGTAVAGNPWNGSALVYALADRPTPFPHMTSRLDPPRQEVAAHLRDAATDPAVCPAVRALHLGYVLDFGTYYLWGGDPGGRDKVFPGLDGLAAAPGFTLADSQGDARLYRITACG